MMQERGLDVDDSTNENSDAIESGNIAPRREHLLLLQIMVGDSVLNLVCSGTVKVTQDNYG